MRAYALQRERALLLAGLAACLLPAWAWLAAASADMYGDMSGLSAWMMQAEWDRAYFLMIVLMWVVMMGAMMLPSALPVTLLFHRVVHSRPQPSRPIQRSALFVGGYLLVWSSFSFGAALLQWLLVESAILSPMMKAEASEFAAGLLITAGVYQWLPLQNVCLERCRSPLALLAEYWRPGARGALVMGLRYGGYCLGCCALLMLLLFVGGVMNLLWIAGLTVLVLVQKLAPFGIWTGRLLGLILIGSGTAMLWPLAGFMQAA